MYSMNWSLSKFSLFLGIISCVFFFAVSWKEKEINPPGERTESGEAESKRIELLIKDKLYIDGVVNNHYIREIKKGTSIARAKSLESGFNFLEYLGHRPSIDTSKGFSCGVQINGGERLYIQSSNDPTIIAEMQICISGCPELFTLLLVKDEYLYKLPSEKWEGLEYFPFWPVYTNLKYYRLLSD